MYSKTWEQIKVPKMYVESEDKQRRKLRPIEHQIEKKELTKESERSGQRIRGNISRESCHKCQEKRVFHRGIAQQ